MIGVKNQYLAYFKVGEYKDFIQDRQLEVFRLIEEAGNILPTFELIFSLSNLAIYRFLNEGNSLEISFGRTENTLMTTRLNIRKRQKLGETIGTVKVRLLGTFDAPNYNIDCKVGTYSGTSLSVMQQVLKNYFRVESNLTKSADQMNWIQPNIPDRSFIQNVWMHSVIKDDTMLTGIEASGIFRIRGIAAALDKKEPDWKFSCTTIDSNKTVIYRGSPEFISNSGIQNYIAGYAKSRIVHNLDTVESSYVTPQSNPILAVTKNRDAVETQRRLSSVSVLNSNMHENYHNAYDSNVRNLMLLNSLQAKVTFQNTYFPVRLLDIVLLKDDSDSARKESSEDSSGFWVVSKIARILSNRNLITVVTLSRDGMNSVALTGG